MTALDQSMTAIDKNQVDISARLREFLVMNDSVLNALGSIGTLDSPDYL